MGPRTYEIIVMGQAGAALRAEFEDCEIEGGADTTTLRAELPDQAALLGLVYRVAGFGLDVLQVRVVAPPPPREAPYQSLS